MQQDLWVEIKWFPQKNWCIGPKYGAGNMYVSKNPTSTEYKKNACDPHQFQDLYQYLDGNERFF